MLLNPQNLRLGIAAHLLNGLVTLNPNRTLADRDQDLDHSLELADELVRRFEVWHGPAPSSEPPPSAAIREEILKPDAGVLAGLLAERRRKAHESRTAAKPPRRPLQ